VKTKLKENPKTLKTTNKATDENKYDVAAGHENEAQIPWKNAQG